MTLTIVRQYTPRSLRALAIPGLAFWVLLAGLAAAQGQHSIFAKGDAVVTGFSGAMISGDALSPGANPLEWTYINRDGFSMRIFELTPNASPQGQLAQSPPVFGVAAAQIGQVFAITFDNWPVPNIYLAATSAFGVQIVVANPAAGAPLKRARRGAPNANWMPGQFGTGLGGGPGSIYKVDGETGVVSLFTTIPGNSGPGLGGMVFDKSTNQFFVSDLDTGLIYRLDMDGKAIDTFDHGIEARPVAGLSRVPDNGILMNIRDPAFDIEKPSTWGLTPKERRVWGLAVNDGRLFYAVADGPQVWSVGLRHNGDFAHDARRDIDGSTLPSRNVISDITFDRDGNMYVAQRGEQRGSYDYSVFAEPRQSAVMRYRPTAQPARWVPEQYAVGFQGNYRNATGGVALGYGYDERGQMRAGACDQMVWSTGDLLRQSETLVQRLLVWLRAGGPTVVHGLQINDRSLVRPQNEPPFKAYFLDYDDRYNDPQHAGYLGGVKVWQDCETKIRVGRLLQRMSP
jgi:hypothetical protein